jgi:hypothetical protein
MPAQSIPVHVRSSAAYAEVLLRMTEVRAELESIAPDYSEASSRLIDLRSELEILNKAARRLSTTAPVDSAKLTLALGKLLVRKASLDADVARLLRTYKADHAEVRKVLKKVEIFEAAIKEVIP